MLGLMAFVPTDANCPIANCQSPICGDMVKPVRSRTGFLIQQCFLFSLFFRLRIRSPKMPPRSCLCLPSRQRWLPKPMSSPFRKTCDRSLAVWIVFLSLTATVQKLSARMEFYSLLSLAIAIRARCTSLFWFTIRAIAPSHSPFATVLPTSAKSLPGTKSPQVLPTCIATTFPAPVAGL